MRIADSTTTPVRYSGRTSTDGAPMMDMSQWPEPGTEDQEDRIRPALMPIGFECRGQWTWLEVSKYMSLVTGKRLSRQRVQAIADRALVKLRLALEDDPVIRDYLEDVGLLKPKDP